MHRPALDRAGSDQRHLDHQVVEPAGLQPRQRRHLRPRLDLEHSNGVGAAQHPVHVVVLRDGRQVDLVAPVFADEVDGVVQRGQHPETEQVELDEASASAVVLVPLQHRALVHPPPLDRAHLDHRPIADHHAARVDAKMPRRVFHLQRQLQHRFGDRAVGLRCGRRHTAPAVDLLRPGILLTRFEPERLGHVAHRRARPVRDHVGDLRCVVTAVALVDVLDHFLSPVALDVDVDVGRAVTLRRQEPLEQQPERDRVGRGDADRVADRRVGGAPPALAEDVRPPTELDDVPHDQEIPGEVELFDQRQLVVDRLPRSGSQRQVLCVYRSIAIAAAGPILGHLAQVLHLAQPVGAGKWWQLRRDERQVERRRSTDLRRPLDDTRIAPEPLGLLGARAEVRTGGGREPRVDLVEAATRPHGGERCRQPALRRGGVVDVVGRDALDALTVGEFGERVVAGGVERVAVIPQLHQHTVAPERID